MKRSKDHKKEEEELDLINRVIEMLKVNAFVKDGEWSAKDVDFLNKHLFLTSKPVIYLVNIGKEEYIKKQNAWLPKIQEVIRNNGGGPMIPFSADFESEVVDFNKEDREE